MVYEYVNYRRNPNQQSQVLKPNAKKIFLKNSLGVLGTLLSIAVTLAFVHFMVGLGTFDVILEVFQVEIDFFAATLYFSAAVALVSAVLIVGNYLTSGMVRYQFYPDKMVAYTSLLMVLTSSKEIPYQNVTRVTFDNGGLFNALFNSGTISLELSGMRRKKIDLEFIDNTEQVAQYIQNLIRQAAVAQQSQSIENYRISNIMNRDY